MNEKDTGSTGTYPLRYEDLRGGVRLPCTRGDRRPRGELWVKALQWHLGNTTFSKLSFVGKFHLVQTGRFGRAGQDPHRLHWARVGTGHERAALSWKVWACLFAPSALEHNQQKGVMLAVGFLRMGSQALSFPDTAISRSGNSSEGFLGGCLMSCLHGPCVWEMRVPRTVLLKAKLQYFFLYFSL